MSQWGLEPFWLKWGLDHRSKIFAAMAAEGAGRGAAAGFDAPVAATGSTGGDAGGFAGGTAGGAAAGVHEAPEVTAAPTTPPLRPHGPFDDEEWARRQALQRAAERSATAALGPLQRWMVAEMRLRQDQHEEIESLKQRLQLVTNNLEVLDRQNDRLIEQVHELKRRRVGQD